MARPCEFLEALTSQRRRSRKNSGKYPWTLTVLISKAPSASASMDSSPNSHHIWALVYAYTPASCDRIAGRPFTNLADVHTASLPISIFTKPNGFCFVELVDWPFLKPSSVHAFAWTTITIVSSSLRPPWRV